MFVYKSLFINSVDKSSICLSNARDKLNISARTLTRDMRNYGKKTKGFSARQTILILFM